MMKRFPLCSLFALLVFFTTSATAENLIDIFNLARKNDPSWASKKQQFLADREKLEQAYGTLLPTAVADASWARQQYQGGQAGIDGPKTLACAEANGVNVTSSSVTLTDVFTLFNACQDQIIGYHDVTQNYTAKQYGVTVTQPILRLDRWERYKRAQSLDNAAKAKLAYDQQDLMIRTSEAYFGVLKAEDQLRLANAENKMLETQMTEIKNRYRLGLVRDTDVFETQAQFDLASAAVIAAQAAVDSLKENLTLLTGQTIDMVSPLPKDIPVEPPQPLALSDWEEFAKKTNYQLIAAEYASTAADRAVSEAKSGHAPTADLFLDYHKSEVGGGFTPSSDTTTIGVRFSMPLYAGGIVSSQVREAEHRKQAAEDDVELARRNALRETRQYHTKVMADVAGVNARLRAVKSNNSSLRAIHQGWETGIRSLTDLLAAQRRVFEARKEYASSRYDYILDTLKLKKAAGVLTPDDLQTLNSWLAAPGSDTVSTLGEDTEVDLKQIDDIKFEKKIKTFDDEKKAKDKGPKSLYDAFKAWRNSSSQ